MSHQGKGVLQEIKPANLLQIAMCIKFKNDLHVR